MRKTIFSYCVLGFMIISNTLFAQTDVVYEVYAADFMFKGNSFNDKIKAPVGQFQNFYIDKEKNLWFSSAENNGIYKLEGDGYKSHNFTDQFDKKMNGPATSFAINSKGIIYAGFEQNGTALGDKSGLYRYDGDWTNIIDKESGVIKLKSISEIKINPKDQVFAIGAYASGTSFAIIHFDGTAWKVFDKENGSLSSIFMSNLTLDNNGVLWMILNGDLDGTSSALAKFDGTKWVEYKDGIPNDIRCIAFDKDNNLMVGTRFGIKININGTWKDMDQRSGEPIKNIQYDKDGFLWVIVGEKRVDNNRKEGTGSKMLTNVGVLGDKDPVKVEPDAVHLFYGDKRIMRLDTNNFFMRSSSAIHEVLVDVDNQKWILTNNAIYKFKTPVSNSSDYLSYHAYSKDNNLQNNAFHELRRDEKGNISVFVDGKAYLIDNTGKFNRVLIDKDGYIDINSYEYDNNGNIFYATNDNIRKFDGKNYTIIEPADKKLLHRMVKKVEIDSKGNIWAIASMDLAKFDGTNWVAFNKKNAELPNNAFNNILIDKKDNVWLVMGSLKRTVVKYDGSTWQTFEKENGIPAATECLVTTPDGTVWAGGQGISKYDGSQWVKVGSNDYYVNYMTVDKDGNIYMTDLSKGIIKKFDGTNISDVTFENWPLLKKKSSCVVDDNGVMWVSSVQNIVDDFTNKFITESAYPRTTPELMTYFSKVLSINSITTRKK